MIFWCAALYVGVAGLISITKQVFWPETAAGWERDCQSGLRELESELLSRASERIAGRGSAHDQKSLRRWLRRWDARHASLRAACDGDGAVPHASLEKLRYHTETLLRRFESVQMPLIRQIDQSIEELSHP